jgi:hypothetical protein
MLRGNTDITGRRAPLAACLAPVAGRPSAGPDSYALSLIAPPAAVCYPVGGGAILPLVSP